MTVGWLGPVIPYILRWHFAGGLGSHLRSHARAAVEYAGTCLVSAAGLFIAGYQMGTWWAMVGLCVASDRNLWLQGPVLVHAAEGPDRHGGSSTSITWINSIPNVGGFFGPWYVGVMKGPDRQL